MPNPLYKKSHSIYSLEIFKVAIQVVIPRNSSTLVLSNSSLFSKVQLVAYFISFIYLSLFISFIAHRI